MQKAKKKKLGIGNLSGFPSSLDMCHFAAGSCSEQLLKSEGGMEICLSPLIFDTDSLCFPFSCFASTPLNSHFFSNIELFTSRC